MRTVRDGLPRLLVSVRSGAEAVAAIEGGADVIDVKEPSAGSLGRAEIPAMLEVAAAVAAAAGKPWTLACGELVDATAEAVASFVQRLVEALAEDRDGLPRPWLVKVGLSQLEGRGWRESLARLRSLLPAGIGQAVVAYADWRACGAPDPESVCRVAASLDRIVLVDTFDKSSGSVFEVAGEEAVARLARLSRREGIMLALAGRIGIADAGRLATVRPHIVAVRSAVCGGGRLGRVDAERVQQARDAFCGRPEAGMMRQFQERLP